MNMNIFDKLLYGIKVANDNIIVVNDKVDVLLKMLSSEAAEPNDVPALKSIGDVTQS